MNRNMTEWRKVVLRSPKRLAVPVMTHPGIELSRHTIPEVVSSGHLHAEAVSILAHRFSSAAATLIMDLSVEAEAFGAKAVFQEGEVPYVTGRVVTAAEDIQRLKVPDLSFGRTKYWLDAAKELSERVTDRPVFGCCIGPFSLAARLYDVTELMSDILIDPDAILPLVDVCSRFINQYCQAFKDSGANGVFIAEPVAGMLSADLCTMFSSNFIKQIISDVQDDSFMVILHNCGETDLLIESMQSTGAAGLHFGNKCNLIAALQQIHPDRLVFGNLDPTNIFKLGSPEQVFKETRDLLHATAKYPNHVISSGCDIPPNTPIANIEAFFAAIAQDQR